MKSKEYKNFKNYLHNDLNVTKDDIEKWTKESIEKIVDQKIDKFMYSNQFTAMVLNKLSTLAKGQITNSFYQSIPFSKYFEDLLRSEIKQLLLKNFNVSIDVNINNQEIKTDLIDTTNK